VGWWPGGGGSFVVKNFPGGGWEFSSGVTPPHLMKGEIAGGPLLEYIVGRIKKKKKTVGHICQRNPPSEVLGGGKGRKVCNTARSLGEKDPCRPVYVLIKGYKGLFP